MSMLNYYCSLTTATDEGHNDNGYSVYIGMDTNTGDLVAIYEWVLRCKQAKNDLFRRQKQVCVCMCLCLCLSIYLSVSLSSKWVTV